MNSEQTPDRTKDGEQWLDEGRLEEALAHYSASEPRMGLETRILAHIQGHVARRQRRWRFAFAAAAVAVLAMVVTANLWKKRTIDSARTSTRPVPSPVVSKQPVVSTMADGENLTSQSVQKPRVISHRRKIGSSQVLTAADVRPSPPVQTDLTEEIAVREMRVSPVGATPELYVSNLRTIEPVEIRELSTKDRN